MHHSIVPAGLSSDPDALIAADDKVTLLVLLESTAAFDGV